MDSVKYAPITVAYIDQMGSDQRVLNVARVSFNKWKSEDGFDERDRGLMAYLESGLASDERTLENYGTSIKHWSPFAHCMLSVRVKAPIFLARQLVKHQVGLSWNEVSRRYVDSGFEFWMPKVFHRRPTGSIKQGSGEAMDSPFVRDPVTLSTASSFKSYCELIELGVAPEEARIVLPLNTMTEWIWTGSLMAFMRVYMQRSDSHAQLAAQEFAGALGNIISTYFPETFKTFTKWSKSHE